MSEFGKQNGGGRRHDARVPTGTTGVLSTLSRSRSVFVREVSLTGARLEGPDLPHEGEEFMLAIGTVKAFATVQWLRGTSCGVHFEEPLDKAELRKLRCEAPVGLISRKLVEAEQAYQDWTNGAAR